MTGAPKAAGTASARKIFNILLSYSEKAPLWTAQELAAKHQISMPTLYRYLAFLRDMGLIEGAGDSSYRLTEEVVHLARAARAGRSVLIEAAMPEMRRIRDEVNETVLIAGRTRDHVYCIERIESLQPVRLQFERGQPMSLHRGSLARVLLSGMPIKERTSYLARVLPEVSEENRALLTPENLEKVRSAGYTQSFDEVDEGIWGTAAAIQRGGEITAAIGVAAPTYRIDARMRGTIIELVREASQRITAAVAQEF
ncbi:IclR family transcriptional regulator [Alphaproteobacteria bacterium KMM 3653]|uniref:IclR family transcriptional regulator n=1 Tax=Harenicola maris TaxID=2841044 RepID=A0AAP2CPF5_9RHOB|nr:IclR family transcriptional regulator [Harenicola maris]